MAYDAIVLGVGGMGSAAAYHLAKRGKRVLALERFAIPHEQGSSHGYTRIIRLAYYEHPSYVPLLRRAYVLWRELEARGGARLLHVTGSINAGVAGSRTFEGSRHSCEVHGVPHEILTSEELTARFPAYRLPSPVMAVFQRDGGFLVPERCIETHAALATAHGADVRTGERVVEWAPTASGVRVTTERDAYEAAQLVVTAGSWTGQLVPSLGRLLEPERQVLAWFDVTDRDLFAPGRFPVFNLDLDERHWYGFPEHGVPGFKVGSSHHFRERVDPDALDRSAVTAADVGLLREFASSNFAAGSGEALLTRVCIFTNTPDEHFIIDRLPDTPQVLVVSPCSGHGFKFCSVMGEIVADLVERDETGHDISLFRLARLGALVESS